MQQTPLTTSQKGLVLRRQAFKCFQCQADLEPAGSAPPHFEVAGPVSKGAAAGPADVRAFCPTCRIKSGSGKAQEEKRERERGTFTTRSGTKLVKNGFDTRKF